MAMKAHGKDIRTAASGVTLEHRHFAFIAGVIAAMPDHAASLRAHKRSTALAFADACGGTNPRFNRERFLAACGEADQNACA
jgi:hypothetical protein